MGRAGFLLVALLVAWTPVPAAGGGARDDFRRGTPIELEFLEFEHPLEPAPVGELLIEGGSSARVSSSVPLVEIRGRLGMRRHDLVLAIDTSGSAFLPSGADVDGDGATAVLRCPDRLCGRPTRWTTDFEDAVISAEVRAAHSLVSLLDPDRTRLGLVWFGRTAAVERPLVSVNGIDGALESFPRRGRSGSDPVAALHQAIELLENDNANGEDTLRGVILLADGSMTFYHENPLKPEEYLRHVLQRARDAGVRIFTFAVGPRAEKSTVLEYFARATGGHFTAVPNPGDVVTRLPMMNFSQLSDIEIRNSTSGEEGRAIRVFPDGSFDGFSPLREGRNQVHVSAVLLNGQEVSANVEVHYTRTAAIDSMAQEQRDLLERLRLRTLETDLARRAQVERKRARRSLKIEAE